MNDLSEVYVEKVHTRKSKTTFKGVVQKMLISSLVLTSVLGSTTGAFAAEAPKVTLGDVKTVAYENGVSVSTAISQIKTTVSRLKMQILQGNIQKSSLESLASQLYQLEKAANGQSSAQIVAVLNSVETAIEGVSGAEQVKVALQQVKDSLGIGSIEDTAKAPKTTAEGVSFGDVQSTAWYYNSVMEMAGQELLQGTGAKDENGMPLFAPTASMNRASYVTIAVRVAYPEELKTTVIEGGNWWDAAYQVAYNHDILSPSDPDFGTNPTGEIRREEMALILQRTAHAKGVATTNLVSATQIPDFQTVGSPYKEAVRECYTLGLLNGVDQQGNFNSQGTLDRASASQSFYKLLNADKRTPVAPVAIENPFANQNKKPSGHQDTSIYQPAATLQTFNEGEAHTIPQAGDTVITKDGRTVVLTSTMIGGREFVGYGQGVDIVTGTVVNGVSVQPGNSGYYELDKTPFVKSKLTGEVYTESQWVLICSPNTYPSDKVGTEDGDIANFYWSWSEADNDWEYVGE